MHLRSASRLSDTVLSLEIDAMCANDRSNCAQLLVYLDEFRRRKLYLPAGYPSLFQYCVQKCRMSEDVAFRRIRAARAARDYPAILTGIANGSLNLTTVTLLAPHLKPHNADELLRLASCQRKAAVELLIANRFPREDLPTAVVPLKCQELAPERVETLCDTVGTGHGEVPSSEPFSEESESPIAPVAPGPVNRVAPLAPERFGLQTTIDGETHELLRRAQDLLGHQIPVGDVAGVLKRALSVLVDQLEKQKFAGSNRPRARSRSARSNSRYLPLHVRKAVWERDGGQCTFEGDSGHRCQERKGLEFDHILPVARGGTATVDNIRLLCPGHNQLEAERVFGTQFMENKREQGRECSALERTG